MSSRGSRFALLALCERIWGAAGRRVRLWSQVPRWERYAFTDTAKSEREQQQLVDVIDRLMAGRTTWSLVDVGCGKGRLRRALAERCTRYVGVEFGAMAEVARRAQPGTPIVNGSIAALPFMSRSADVVVAQGVIENLSEWRTAVEELTRVAAQYALFTAPADELAKSTLNEIPGVGIIRIRTIDRPTLRRLVEAHRWTVQEFACGSRGLFVLSRREHASSSPPARAAAKVAKDERSID